MRAELRPGKLQVICESEEEKRALIVHCCKCGSLFYWLPKTKHARLTKRATPWPNDWMLGVAAQDCCRCNKDNEEIAGQHYLGRFPVSPAILDCDELPELPLIASKPAVSGAVDN